MGRVRVGAASAPKPGHAVPRPLRAARFVIRGMGDNRDMSLAPTPPVVDTPLLRKARGAFFTPAAITRYVANWAIRDKGDSVLEPSAGDAAFLVEAVRRLKDLAGDGAFEPHVSGVEIHPESAQAARARVRRAGGVASIETSDFFQVRPEPRYSVVIGNPPYIRYQDFSGESRRRAREAAMKAGVPLTALASSWAAFTVHSALFLRPGGRLALVLPAELLSVNYAATVRRFLFDRFRSVELVLFEEQVFSDAEADVVLLLADGFDAGPADHAVVHQARDAEALGQLKQPLRWVPPDPAGKWTGLLVNDDAIQPLQRLVGEGHFGTLQDWGDTTLGMVTGNNNFFALSPQRVAALGLRRHELVRLSPPGSSHLRGLELSSGMMARLGRKGKATWLFRPTGVLSEEAAAYVLAGHRAGVDQAYKCRVRKPWYRVPLLPPADLLLTCMNADTPRLTTNSSKAHHLNSVHGVYLRESSADLGRELLPLASLNSVTLLNAEMVGRSYGGGILKLEPREADAWAQPSFDLVERQAAELRAIKPDVARLLRAGNLGAAVSKVDEVLLLGANLADIEELALVSRAHEIGRAHV